MLEAKKNIGKFGKFEEICQSYTHPQFTVIKLAQIWLILATKTNAPFCPTGDDSNRWLWFTKSSAKDGLVKALSKVFINEDMESSHQFGKFYLLPMFVYAPTTQSFNHQTLKFTDLPKFSLITVLRYSTCTCRYSVPVLFNSKFLRSTIFMDRAIKSFSWKQFSRLKESCCPSQKNLQILLFPAPDQFAKK